MASYANKATKVALPQAPGDDPSVSRKSAICDNAGVVKRTMPRAKVVELPAVVRKPIVASVADPSLLSRTPLKEKESNLRTSSGRKKWRKKTGSNGSFSHLNADDAAVDGSFEKLAIQVVTPTTFQAEERGFSPSNVCFRVNVPAEGHSATRADHGLDINKSANTSNKSQKKVENAAEKRNKSSKKQHMKDEMNYCHGDATQAGVSLPILSGMESPTESMNSGKKENVEPAASTKQHQKKSKKKFGRGRKKSLVDNVSSSPYHVGYDHNGYPYVTGRDFSTNTEGAAILASIGQRGHVASDNARCESNQRFPVDNFPANYDPHSQAYPSHPAYIGYAYEMQYAPDMYQYPDMMHGYYAPAMANWPDGVVYYNQAEGYYAMAYGPAYYYNYAEDFPQNGGNLPRAALNIDAPSFEPKEKVIQ